MQAHTPGHDDRAPSPRTSTHALEFGGSGSEYFRIWIVNLLLTLVTLGLYYPWAKVRKLRYFYGNTRLAGHSFDFHGDPKRMLRGYLLVGLLFAAYAFAGHVSPVASLGALAILAAIWPALLAASMRFRLSQTSWRGLRFRFAGGTAGAYKALLPAFAAALLMLAVSYALAPEPQPLARGARPQPPSGAALAAMFGAMALVFALSPLTLWMLKRYQHDHYQYAGLRTRLDAGAGAFYKLAFKAAGLLLLVALATGTVSGVMAAGLGGGEDGRPSLRVFLVVMLGIVAIYAAMLLVLHPYFVSRLQNLVWSRTESRLARFRSELRFWPLARRMLANVVFTVLTLGLYWPFAAVATARLRLQAVSVDLDERLDALVAQGGRGTQDAAGDAAGDVFGIDLGL